MQKRDPIRRILSQPTNRPKVPHLPPPPLNPLQKLLQRTAPARSPIAPGNRHDPIVHIDSHGELVARRLAVDVVGVEGRVVPAGDRSGASEALEEHAAAHGDYVGGAPGAVAEGVGCGEVRGLGEEGEGGEEGGYVAVVDAGRGGVSLSIGGVLGGEGGVYKLRKSSPASGPERRRFAVALRYSQPIVAP